MLSDEVCVYPIITYFQLRKDFREQVSRIIISLLTACGGELILISLFWSFDKEMIFKKNLSCSLTFSTLWVCRKFLIIQLRMRFTSIFLIRMLTLSDVLSPANRLRGYLQAETAQLIGSMTVILHRIISWLVFSQLQQTQ